MLLFVAACGGGGAVNITKTVGMEGGTVSHSDGSGVTIPAGALTANSMITLATVNVTAPAGTVLVGPAYDFGPAGTVFSQPVTITLPFTASKLPAGRTSADILIYTAPLGSTQYTALATTVAGSTVQTTTTHFTVFVPAVKLPTDGGSGGCTPVCAPDSAGTGCTCSANCSGHEIFLGCSRETSNSPLSCYCEVDSQTQPGPSIPPSACNASAASDSFQECFGQP
jgi:hypothetical protein